MFNGKKMRKLRNDLGLTQKELGKLVHVTNVSISGYEKNKRKPDVDTLTDIARCLNTTPNYLLDFDVEVTLNEEVDNTYNRLFVSEEDINVINELKKYEKLKNQIYGNPKKWFKDINNRYN